MNQGFFLRGSDMEPRDAGRMAQNSLNGLLRAMTSRSDQVARTPSRLYREIRLTSFPHNDSENEVVFDPCPPKPTFDGLEVAWRRWNYVNPPFSDAARWITKAIQETSDPTKLVSMLLPMRSASRWFRDLEQNSTILLWVNHTPFAGYVRPLAIPMVVALLPRRTPRPVPRFTFYPVRGGTMTLPTAPSAEIVLHTLHEMYPGESVSIVCQNPAKFFCIPTEQPTIVVVPATSLKTQSFKALTKHISHIHFITPRLWLGGVEMFAPSVVVRILPEPATPPSEPWNLYFAVTDDAYRRGADNEPAEIV